MNDITNMGEMNREVNARCVSLGLRNDCGPDGIFQAEIAVIGEAPGERERIMKLPLVGMSGKYLWEELRKIGINRRMVYISNVVKRQLRDATTDEKVGISRNEIDQYAQILRWELQNLPNLKYIICLGNYALEAVTGLTGITHHRGSAYQTQIASLSQQNSRDVTVYAMLNPAAVIREPKWEVMYRHDVARLKTVIEDTFKPHLITEHINPSFTEAMQWIERMRDEKEPVSLDIEVIANETACIGFANNPHEGMCINFRDRTANRFSVAEEIELRRAIQSFVADPDTRLVMQNGMFDSYWLYYKDRIQLGRSYFDTMLAHHTLYPQLPHNLGFLTSQYTTHPFYKDEGKAWREGGDIDDFWRYNVKDCCITHAVHRAELSELRNQNLERFFFDHVMRLQPHLIGMVVGGVKIDTSLKDTIARALGEEVAELREKFYEQAQIATGEADYRPNPKSPKQLAELFFRKLRLVGRGVATDEKNRRRMLDHPRTTPEAREMLLTLNKLAKESKFLTTYAESKIDEDDRIRCEYKQTGVQSAPGRLSSSGVLWGTGMNLQNQPGRAHQMFIADDGYEFSYFDLSQAEARVVGWKAGIQHWIDDFERARIDGVYDAHRALASTMFDIPYDEVPKDDWNEDGSPTKRYIAKRCRHGLNYRMGADRLAETAGLTLREAHHAYHVYHKINPELQEWWDWTTKQVKDRRVLYNYYGRRWMLLERLDEQVLSPIVAFYPQSTIGDKVSRCIYLCETDPEWPTGEARMALNIHDALIALHKAEHGDVVRRIMKKYAEEPMRIEDIRGVSRELIIPCDLKRSVPDEHGIHRWSNMEKVKLAA